MRKGLIYISLVFLFLSGVGNIHAQNIDIEFTGIRSNKGQFLIEVFRSETEFKDEKSWKQILIEKEDIRDGRMTASIDLPPGIYGLTLVDDENRNGEMDYKMIRMTKEGFGFSDFYLSGLKKPKFSEFKFVIEEGRNYRIEMKIRYM